VESQEDQRTITELLDCADGLCADSDRFLSRRRFTDWWNGGRVEEAWILLHHAEALIIAKCSDALLPDLLEVAVACAGVLDQTDPARVRLSKYVEEVPQPPGAATESTTTPPPPIVEAGVAEVPSPPDAETDAPPPSPGHRKSQPADTDENDGSSGS